LARLLRPYEPSAVEAKKRKLQETKGRPNHWGGLLYIVDLERRRIGKILGVSRKPKRIQFWNKSWWDAVDTNRVRMAADVEETRG
jgi:hypothetical protein